MKSNIIQLKENKNKKSFNFSSTQKGNGPMDLKIPLFYHFILTFFSTAFLGSQKEFKIFYNIF